MPNQPRDDNPTRAIRIDDALWTAAKERAAERGESVSEAVRAFLRRYTK
jgi:antitoxin component of RelBE/YafQ-DinJ toxin-antitoxin module